MTMVTRYTKVPVTDSGSITGIPYYTNGVITHTVRIDEVWLCDAQVAYDSPRTVWIQKEFEEFPPLNVEDENGNPV